MHPDHNLYVDAYNLHILLNQNVDSIANKVGSDLSYGQYVILNYIADKGGMVSQKDLDHWSSIRRATLSQHLKSLCRRGYVERGFVEGDNRSKEIVLTEKAVLILKKMDREMKLELTGKVSLQEREEYHVLLGKIKDAFSGIR